MILCSCETVLPRLMHSCLNLPLRPRGAMKAAAEEDSETSVLDTSRRFRTQNHHDDGGSYREGGGSHLQSTLTSAGFKLR